MVETMLFLAVMAVLFQNSEISKWWLWFATIIGLAAIWGLPIGMFGLIFAIALWKLVKDLCTAGRRK